MKIVGNNGGRLCNKLWSYAELIAHSLHYEETMYVYDFNHSNKNFENLNRYKKIIFVNNKFRRKILNILIYLARKTGRLYEFNLLKKTRGLCFVDGWEYRRGNYYLREYRDKVVDLFRPNKMTTIKCEIYAKKLRSLNGVLVGVHIRRCDYREFNGGVYFFGDDVYFRGMIEINEYFTCLGKTCSFIVCSDENIDLGGFEGLDVSTMPDASEFEDLFLLSLCDYLLGPPSTYSMWASFAGKVPLYIIRTPDDHVEIKNFKVVSAVDVFEDGSLFEHVH